MWSWWGRLHMLLWLSSLQMAYLAKCRECVIYGTGSMKCSNLTVQTVGNRNIYGTGSISPQQWAIDQRCTLIKMIEHFDLYNKQELKHNVLSMSSAHGAWMFDRRPSHPMSHPVAFLPFQTHWWTEWQKWIRYFQNVTHKFDIRDAYKIAKRKVHSLSPQSSH